MAISIRHGFIDSSSAAARRQQSWPPAKRMDHVHIDSRKCPKYRRNSTEIQVSRANRPSGHERSAYKRRQITFTDLSGNGTWLLNLKLLVQLVDSAWLAYIHDIERILGAFPEASCMKCLIYSEFGGDPAGMDEAAGRPPVRRPIGLFYIADLDRDGLLLLDWWVIPEFCQEDVFQAIGRWVICDVFSPKKPMAVNPLLRYEKSLLCHPLANSIYQDTVVTVLQSFGMQAACQEVKSAIREAAHSHSRGSQWLVDYFDSHYWLQWGPLTTKDFQDQRATLLREGQQTTQSLPPSLEERAGARRAAMRWWGYRVRKGRQLWHAQRCVPSWPLESLEELLHGAEDMPGLYEVREGRVGVLAVTADSSLLRWRAGFGLWLRALFFPRFEELQPCKGGKVEVIGNLKTEVYVEHLGEVLMREVRVDPQAARQEMDLQESRDCLDINIELRPLVSDNGHLLDTVDSSYPLKCYAQIICIVRTGELPMPPQALILKWVLSLQE